MKQKTIREFNSKEFTVTEAAEWHKEFNDRTKSTQTGFNSIDELATIVQQIGVSNLADFFKKEIPLTATSGTISIDYSAGRRTSPLVLTGATTITFTNLFKDKVFLIPVSGNHPFVITGISASDIGYDGSKMNYIELKYLGSRTVSGAVVHDFNIFNDKK